MAQQKMAEQTILGRISAREDTQSEISMRLVGALLALAIAAVHVADQGEQGPDEPHRHLRQRISARGYPLQARPVRHLLLRHHYSPLT